MMHNEPGDIKERTFEFAVRVATPCRELDGKPGASRTVANQLLRSGTSIGANLEEAHGSQSKPDFITRISIATKEARETNYWLRLLGTAKIIPAEKLIDIADESNQLVAILTAIVKNPRTSK